MTSADGKTLNCDLTHPIAITAEDNPKKEVQGRLQMGSGIA
jgi:hypothetical protein